MTESTVTVAHEEQLTVTTPDRMVIDSGDWARVRRAVERLGEPLAERVGTFGTLLVGAAVTLLGVAIGLEHATPAPSTNLLTGLWVSFCFCVVFGPVFFWIGSRDRRRYRTSNRGVCEDMDDIAQRVGKPGLGVIPSAPRLGLKERATRLIHGDPLHTSKDGK
jgi:hypothetical protein